MLFEKFGERQSLKNLVHAKANARGPKTGFFAALLFQVAYVIITEQPFGICLQISLCN